MTHCPDVRPEFGVLTRIVSLLDMLRFYALDYVSVRDGLEEAKRLLIDLGPDAPIDEVLATNLADAGRFALNAVQELPVHVSTLDRAARLAGSLNNMGARDRATVINLIDEVRRDLVHELRTKYFLILPEGRRELLEQKEPLFGPEVDARADDDLRDEIRAAGRCLAYDEWTAAVFHLMRVLERGLRDISKRLKLKFPRKPIDYQDWEGILQAIETKIQQLKNPQGKPLTGRGRARVEYLSDAVSQFRIFKDAWRNYVSHSRGFYGETEAFKVFRAVEHFMQALAKGPKKREG